MGRTYSEETAIVELVSLYGYSLTPFIVSCILCIAPWNTFDWIVVMMAMCLSMWFLVKNVYHPLDEEKRSKPGIEKSTRKCLKEKTKWNDIIDRVPFLMFRSL